MCKAVDQATSTVATWLTTRAKSSVMSTPTIPTANSSVSLVYHHHCPRPLYTPPVPAPAVITATPFLNCCRRTVRLDSVPPLPQRTNAQLTTLHAPKSAPPSNHLRTSTAACSQRPTAPVCAHTSRRAEEK
jgi:hypothetical protein